MIQITAINFAGERFVLSPAEDKYAIKKITGLSPQGGTIATQKMARHGTEYINSTTDERNIVIDLKILGDVEENRNALYAAFPPALPVTLEITTNTKKATIVGYTEENDADWFEMISTAQLSIICPDPFFRAQEATYEATEEEAAVVVSSCPYEAGYGVSVAFTEAVNIFILTNITTNEFLTINHNFEVGDTLEIDTEERTVYINGENAYNAKSGDWALLRAGRNLIVPTAPATIKHTDRYIGL